jgi:ribosomal-protein-alanine acetyltransferase
MKKRAAQFVIVWEFRVPARRRRAFEKAYSPDGVWSAFFRTGKGYIRTELIRDRKDSLRYLTLDLWNSRQDYERFKKENRAKYQAIDKKCESLTASEKRIGEFATVDAGISQNSRIATHQGASVSIRVATPQDISAIVALERDSPAAAHWPEPTYRRIFSEDTPQRIALVAAEGHSNLHGFVIARTATDDCELENIVVLRKRQNRGIGSQLVRSLATAARNQNASRIFLEVRESNAAARALYESCGFAITGRRPSYYNDPVEDAILYTRQL